MGLSPSLTPTKTPRVQVKLLSAGMPLSLEAELRRGRVSHAAPSGRPPCSVPNELALTVSEDATAGGRELDAATVGPLAAAAKNRWGRYWEPPNFSLCLTAGFNVCVVGSLGAR